MQKKQMIMILSFILIAGFGVVYLMLYKPLVTDIETLREDLEITELEYVIRQNRIETLGALGGKIDTAKEEIEKFIPLFYSDTTQEDLIAKINSLCENSEVRLLGIDYSGTSEFQIVQKTTDSAFEMETFSEAGATGLVQAEDIPLYGDVFGVTFVGSYEKIRNMLNLIDTNEKIIVNSGLEVSTDITVTSYVNEEFTTAYPDTDFQKIMLEEGALTCKIQIVFFQTVGLEGYSIRESSILEEAPREKSTSGDPFREYINEALEGDTSE